MVGFNNCYYLLLKTIVTITNNQKSSELGNLNKPQLISTISGWFHIVSYLPLNRFLCNADLSRCLPVRFVKCSGNDLRYRRHQRGPCFKISQPRIPSEIAIDVVTREHWYDAWIWPVLKTLYKQSHLAKGGDPVRCPKHLWAYLLVPKNSCDHGPNIK